MVFGFADLPAMLPAVNEGKGPRLSHQAVERRLLVEQRANAVAQFWLALELEYERRLLRDLMAESPDGIYFKDSELRFVRANSSFGRAVGGRHIEVDSAPGMAPSSRLERRSMFEPGGRQPGSGQRQYDPDLILTDIGMHRDIPLMRAQRGREPGGE